MSAEGSVERAVAGMRRSVYRTRQPFACFVAVAVAIALLAGLTGCSFIADTLQRKTTPDENHKYQRITAVNTKKEWPNIDVITFVEEGRYLGSGTWSAGAVVTIDGKDYRQILGPYSGGGEEMPLPIEDAPPSPLTVNYSDGSSEVIE